MTPTNTINYLSDEALGAVAGGLNPQPLPPGPDSFRSLSSLFSGFAINQHFTLAVLQIPAVPLMRFRRRPPISRRRVSLHLF
jgi:hypothetical protein